MPEILAIGTFWWYKGKQYRIVARHEAKLTQDPLGDWVGTVEYEAMGVRDLTFFRAWTDFCHKFGAKN